MTLSLKVMNVWRHQQNPWIALISIPAGHPDRQLGPECCLYFGLTILTVGGVAPSLPPGPTSPCLSSLIVLLRRGGQCSESGHSQMSPPSLMLQSRAM